MGRRHCPRKVPPPVTVPWEAYPPERKLSSRKVGVEQRLRQQVLFEGLDSPVRKR